MNRLMIKAFSYMSVLVMAAACNAVTVDEDMTGRVSVNMSQDTSEDIVLKSLVAPSEDQVFTLDFIRTYKDGTAKSEYTCRHTDIPAEGVSLPVGPYVVKASCGANSEAAFGEPFYTGEASVNIMANTEHTVDLTAYLSNVKVTVDFTDEIKTQFKEYKVTVSNSRGGTLVFSNTATPSTIDSEGYFKVGENETLTWTLDLVNNKDVKYSATDTYTDVQAREHYNIQFALGEKGEDVGGLYLTIKVDNDTEVKDYFAGVDFLGNDGPSITVNPEFEELLANEDVTIPYGVEESKVVTLTATKGLKSVVISHCDQNLYARGLPYFTELSGAKPAQISALETIGIKASATSYGVYEPVTVDVTGFMASLPMDKSYKMDFYIYDVYNHMAHLPLDFSVVVDADADMVKVEPDAESAVVTGRWFVNPRPSGLTFWYKEASALSWEEWEPSLVVFDENTMTFTAEITGLNPGADYYVKAVSSDDIETREMSFTTIAPQLYNMGFEYWHIDGKLYYPYPVGASSSEKVWDAANKALTQFGQSSSTTYVTDHVHGGGRAVRMESKSVMGIAFAAGNIYTGEFVRVNTEGGTGAILKWGTPFTYRPVALRGWYDYTSTKITDAKDPYTSLKGTPDKCSIVVFLTDWDESQVNSELFGDPDERFMINTVSGKFVKFESDEHIIAYGELKSDVTTNGYVEFVIPLEYRNSRKPKFAVIACSSSALGDYFTGGKGSVLYVDDLSFEYDITTLSAEDQAKVNLK